MGKRRWKEFVKSFFGSHIDPEKDEQLKGTKAEIEYKVNKILEIIKEEDIEEQDGIPVEKSRRHLVDLVEDFHKHYQSLYDKYDHLTGEIRKKFHGKKDADSSSSNSDSDSDSDHSSKDKGSKNGQLKNEYENITDGSKQQIEAGNSEISELRSTLMAATDEKEALHLQHQANLSKLKEAEEIIKDLKLEVERLSNEKGQVLVENGELIKKLEMAANIEAELKQRLDDGYGEREKLIAGKEAAMKRSEEVEKNLEESINLADWLKTKKVASEQKVKELQGEVSGMMQQLELAEQRVLNLSQNVTAAEEENKSLSSQLKLLNESLEDMNSEKDSLMEEKENAVRRIEEEEKNHKEFRTLADNLQVEKATLEQELDTLKEKLSKVSQQLQTAEEKASDLAYNLKLTEDEKNVLTTKFSEITNEIEPAKNTIEELLAESSQLKSKLGDRERVISSLAELHQAYGNESSARIEELEAQVTGLQLELEELRVQNRDLEVEIGRKASEADLLRGEKQELEAQISEWEVVSKERGEELSTLKRKLEENESQLLSTTESLTAQVNVLLEDMESLRSQKAEIEKEMVSRRDEALVQVKGLMDQVSILKKQNESVRIQKNELEAEVHRKIGENSEYLHEIQNLKEQIISKNEDQERLVQEKEGLAAQLQNVEVAMATLANKKTVLEKEISNGIEECGRLREEKIELRDKILELEKIISEKGMEFSALQEIHANKESEASVQTIVLKAQVDSLQQELDTLQAEKHHLQLQLEQEKQEYTKRITEMESQESELLSQIANLQRLLEGQEEAYKKLGNEYKQVEDFLQECRADLGVAEKKLQGMAEELHNNTVTNDQTVVELEEMIEDLKRDLEVKGDELHTSVDNVRNIEVKLRLSNQKLRVTEQLLTEKEESFRQAEAKYLGQQHVLEDKVTTLSGIIDADNAAYQKMVAGITEKVNGTLTGMEALSSKFANDHSRYGHSIEKISYDIQSAKKRAMEMTNEKEQLGKEVSGLLLLLETTKERESSLREKVEQLEVKVRKGDGDNENLVKLVNQLENKTRILETTLKEKDEGIVDLGEEKREAIRQLCLWIDYHRNRYDDLREMISKFPLRGQRA